jgi:hypothetical protein
MRKVAGAAVATAAVLGLLGTQLAGCQRSDDRIAPSGKAVPVVATPAAAGSQASAPAVDAQAGKRGLGAPHKGGDKPLWRALSPAQQLALQPLQGEWDQMDGVRKQKWLQLASRFSAMKPEEQQRVHERMREWVKLTPEQRELARETYNRTRKITQDEKTATWESYQQLPDEQKKKLAASGRKGPSVLPSQASGKVVVPLGRGVTSCPAGMLKNPVSASPPCVSVPAPASNPPPSQQPAPNVPPATSPTTPPPAPQPQPDKPQVPANWGISPNNA